MFKDRSEGYGLISIIVHWCCALAIVFLFAIGVYMVDLSYGSSWYHRGPALHISVGLGLLIVMMFRLVWRITSSTPKPLPNHSKLVRLGASTVKILLYVLVFSLLLSGYLITSAEGQGPSLFGWFDFPAFWELPSKQVDVAGLIHKYFAWFIIVLAAVHGGAAMVHHFWHRDRTLVRMLKPVK